jgi:hypothetical protein
MEVIVPKKTPVPQRAPAPAARINAIFGSPYSPDTAASLVLYEADFTKQVKQLGFVLVAPQVPQWMSQQYPDVIAAAEAGGPGTHEYTREWFDQIVYIEATDEGLIDQHEALVVSNALLKTPYSRGCSRSAPLVRLTKFVQKNTPAEPSDEMYHALVMDYHDAEKTKVKEIGILPVPNKGAYIETLVESLRKFVGSERHGALRRLDPPDEARHRAVMLGGR